MDVITCYTIKCHFLSMLGFKLNHFSDKGPMYIIRDTEYNIYLRKRHAMERYNFSAK